MIARLASELAMADTIETALIMCRMMVTGMSELNAAAQNAAIEEGVRRVAAIDSEITTLRNEMERKHELSMHHLVTHLEIVLPGKRPSVAPSAVVVLPGRNVLTTRTKPRDTLKGTFKASRAAHRVFPFARFPLQQSALHHGRGYLSRTARILLTHKLSTFVRRAIPVVGLVILARDVADISFNSVRLYNTIDRREDKSWQMNFTRA